MIVIFRLSCESVRYFGGSPSFIPATNGACEFSVMRQYHCKWVEINKCMHALKRMTIPIPNVFYGLLWFSFLAFQLVFFIFLKLLDLFSFMKHFQRTNANRSRDWRMIDKQLIFFTEFGSLYGKNNNFENVPSWNFQQESLFIVLLLKHKKMQFFGKMWWNIWNFVAPRVFE